MRALATTSVIVAMIFAFVVPASATLWVDATFGSGAVPTDLGYTAPGGASKAAGWVDTASGLWKVNAADGEYGYWSNASLPGTITDTLFHGDILVKQYAFSTNFDDENLIRLKKDNAYYFDLMPQTGGLRVQYSSYGTNTSFAVANTDGLQHDYGWELNGTTLSVFFDRSLVGTLNVASTLADGSEHYWGDGAGGKAHSEDWDRFTISSGAYPTTPEPSAMVLVGCGLLGLLAYAWRKRR
jgi:hypothetical protein